MSFEQDPADQADISGADLAIMRDEMARPKATNEQLVNQMAVISNERGLRWTLDEKAAGLLRDFIVDDSEGMAIVLSVGASIDDDGHLEYGLRVFAEEYPEEGCMVLAECQPADFQKAFFDVIGERLRQHATEGWTPAHDDAHNACELARGAACYAMNAAMPPSDKVPTLWPWLDCWWKPTTPRRDLVKAGALILAEIERLDRAEANAKAGG